MLMISGSGPSFESRNVLPVAAAAAEAAYQTSSMEAAMGSIPEDWCITGTVHMLAM
jgi:hypothetical protein